MRFLLILICFSFTCATTLSQSYLKNGKYNRLGLQGKYALLDVSSSNVAIKGGEGFLGGLTTRGRFYNNWSMVYGIDFLSVQAEVGTLGTAGLQDEKTTYTLIGAQLNLLLSYGIIGQNLSIEVGLALLVNGYTSLTARSC